MKSSAQISLGGGEQASAHEPRLDPEPRDLEARPIDRVGAPLQRQQGSGHAIEQSLRIVGRRAQVRPYSAPFAALLAAQEPGKSLRAIGNRSGRRARGLALDDSRHLSTLVGAALGFVLLTGSGAALWYATSGVMPAGGMIVAGADNQRASVTALPPPAFASEESASQEPASEEFASKAFASKGGGHPVEPAEPPLARETVAAVAVEAPAPVDQNARLPDPLQAAIDAAPVPAFPTGIVTAALSVAPDMQVSAPEEMNPGAERAVAQAETDPDLVLLLPALLKPSSSPLPAANQLADASSIAPDQQAAVDLTELPGGAGEGGAQSMEIAADPSGIGGTLTSITTAAGSVGGGSASAGVSVGAANDSDDGSSAGSDSPATGDTSQPGADHKKSSGHQDSSAGNGGGGSRSSDSDGDSGPSGSAGSKDTKGKSSSSGASGGGAPKGGTHDSDASGDGGGASGAGSDNGGKSHAGKGDSGDGNGKGDHGKSDHGNGGKGGGHGNGGGGGKGGGGKGKH